MTAFEASDSAWSSLAGAARMAVPCLSGRGGMLDCQPVWTALVIAIVLVALLVVVFVIRHIVRDYLKHRAAVRRWQADQAIASEDEMARVKWRGEQSVADAGSEKELAAQIKQALENNKNRT